MKQDEQNYPTLSMWKRTQRIRDRMYQQEKLYTDVWTEKPEEREKGNWQKWDDWNDWVDWNKKSR